MSSLTQRDSSQIERYEHDESVGAKRVYIVGGVDIKADFDTSQIATSIASAVKEGLEGVVAPSEAKEVVKLEIVEIEKPVVVKETQVVEVEKQVVVTQKELVYVDKPMVVERVVYKEIEKPIIVKESVANEKQTTSPIIVACAVIQALTVVVLAILKFKG